MKIDAKGLSCPEPVLLVMQAVEKGEQEIEIAVDTNISVENVRRSLEKSGYTVSSSEADDFFIVTGRK